MNKASKSFLKDLLKVMDKHNVTLWGNDIDTGKKFRTHWTFVDTSYSKPVKQRINLDMGQVEGEVI